MRTAISVANSDANREIEFSTNRFADEIRFGDYWRDRLLVAGYAVEFSACSYKEGPWALRFRGREYEGYVVQPKYEGYELLKGEITTVRVYVRTISDIDFVIPNYDFRVFCAGFDSEVMFDGSWTSPVENAALDFNSTCVQ